MNQSPWCHVCLISLLCLSACSGGGNSGSSGGSGSGGSGGGSGTSSTISSVSVSCTPASITTAQTSACTATVSGTGSYSSAVSWTATNGTVSSAGVFTPAAAGSASVTATSTQDTSKTGSSSVAVTQASSITSVAVSCTPTVVPGGKTSQCTATVTGTGSFNSAVTWSASSGAIASATATTATYTAPAHAAGSVTITATSAADSTRTGTATLNSIHAPPSGSWKRVGPTGALDMSVLTEDQSHPGTIYASGYGQASGGLWKSTDSGGTWTNVVTNTLLDQLPLSDIAVVNGGLSIYAASIRSSKFFQSLDGGTTWNTIVTPVGSGSIGGMAVDPSNPSNIYLSVGGTGVLKSTDQGSTWSLLAGSPVITDSSLTDILHNPLAVDPTTPTTIYYGTDHGLYISTNAGVSWAQTSPGIAGTDNMIRDIAPGAAGSHTMWLLAGAGSAATVDLYVSSDQGGSWTLKASGVDAQRVNPDPLDGTILYLCGFTTHWVYKSVDSGVTFLKADNGLPPGVDPSAGPIQVFGPIGVLLPLKSTSTTTSLLVATYDDGIFKTTDSAANWTAANSGISSLPGTDVAVDPTNPQNIFLGTSGSGIFKSSDGGSTWTNIASGTFYAVAVDPFSSSHILANELTSDGKSHLRQSLDGGATWTEITPTAFGTTPTISTINFHPQQQGTIFVALTSGAGLFRSTDGGTSWTSVKTLTSQTTVGDCVAFNPANPQSILVTDSNLMYISTDGGNTWAPQGGNATCPLAVDAQASPAVLYAGVPAYKSTDFGRTWTALNVTGRAIPDPAIANGIFMVGKQSTGQPDIQWSPDGGTTWYPISTTGLGWPILQPNVQQGLGLAVSPADAEQLYVTSLTNSIFLLPVGP